MKYFYLAVLILFAGCAEENNSGTGSDTAPQADSITTESSGGLNKVVNPDSITMEADTTPTPANTFKSTFVVYYTTSYCGGARPTEEIVQQNAMPRLLTNSTMKFKNHHNGIVYTGKTNASGEIEIEMEEGKYDVYFTADINPSLPTGFDGKCKSWLNELLYTVKVADDGKQRKVTVHFKCNPCDVNMKRRP